MTEQPIQRIAPITAEQENFRVVPVPGLGMLLTPKRDGVEPVPVGSYVALVFQVTGYTRDCDGSLLANLAKVNAAGEETGWEETGIGLRQFEGEPPTAWLLSGPDALDPGDQQ